MRRISLIEPTWKFEEGKTLIFFEEVQDLPQIAASLKSFAQDGRFDVIASGSMLGIQYKQISSLSLGYKTDVEMLAMDFEEFLRAKGYQDSFFEDLYGKMREARLFGYTPVDARCGSSRDDAVVRGTERGPKAP